MKGIQAISFSSDDFNACENLAIPLKVKHLKFWYIAPDTTYLALYVEAVDKFFVLNIQSYVRDRFGDNILTLSQDERFRRSKDVGPWVGLTPGRDQSGERDIVGGITKCGDAGLRTALYQAATVMLNSGGPNWLKAWAQRLSKLRGKKRATVALARRIGVVLHRMWRDGTEFRFTREEAMALRTA